MGKILFVGGGSYVYGAEIVTLKVIEGLKKKGFDVFCTVSGWNDGVYIQRLNQIGVLYKEIYLGWLFLTKPLWTLDSLIHLPKALYQYRKLLKDIKPDYVYFYSYRPIALLYRLLKGNNILNVQESPNTKLGRTILPRIDKKIFRYIACSEHIQSELINLGIDKDKITLVYNSTDFDSPGAMQKAVVSTPCKIGIVGQITQHKGHEVLLAALQIVKEQGFEFKLYIFGSGDEVYVRRLRDLAKQAGLNTNIEWKGFVSNPKDIYKSVDFTVVPTIKNEPFGLVAIEPSVYGRPVIASRNGGLKEIVQDGITGYLVSPNNSQELAEKIMMFLGNPESIALLGTEAYHRYKNKFSDEVMINAYCSLLSSETQLD